MEVVLRRATRKAEVVLESYAEKNNRALYGNAVLPELKELYGYVYRVTMRE
jgi:hypothetical protein